MSTKSKPLRHLLPIGIVGLTLCIGMAWDWLSTGHSPQARFSEFFSTAKPKQTPLWDTDTTVYSDRALENTLSSKDLNVSLNSAPSYSNHSDFIFYNLKNYLEQPPRTPEGSTIKKDPREITKILNVLEKTNPSLLAVCEIGTQNDLLDLQKRLEKRGITLPYTHLTHASDPLRHLAILSKFPIEAHPYKSPHYTLDGRERTIRRGIIDVSVSLPDHKVRLLGVHLKSKRPLPYADHNLIRRHEAQLVRRHIESILETRPQTHLLVFGDLNDSKQSSSIKAIRGSTHTDQHLELLTLAASDGSRWTHYWAHEDNYSRIDFMMVNHHLKPYVTVPTPSLLPLSARDNGSDHRALHIRLKHN